MIEIGVAFAMTVCFAAMGWKVLLAAMGGRRKRS